MDLLIEIFNKLLHERAGFDCGVEALNLFLQKSANQNQKKNFSKTYVAIDANDENQCKKIYGYYTLTSGQIYAADLPQNNNLNLPKYPVPIIRMARLATDKQFQGQGIGGFLLYAALKTVLEVSNKIGIYAIVVDAKNEFAKNFYKQYGFIELQNNALTLFLPLDTIAQCTR